MIPLSRADTVGFLFAVCRVLHLPRAGQPREVLPHPLRGRVVRVGRQALCQLGGEVIQVFRVLFHGLHGATLDGANRAGWFRRGWGRA